MSIKRAMSAGPYTALKRWRFRDPYSSFNSPRRLCRRINRFVYIFESLVTLRMYVLTTDFSFPFFRRWYVNFLKASSIHPYRARLSMMQNSISVLSCTKDTSCSIVVMRESCIVIVGIQSQYGGSHLFFLIPRSRFIYLSTGWGIIMRWNGV